MLSAGIRILFESLINILGNEESESKIEGPGDDWPYFYVCGNLFAGVVVDEIEAECGH